MSKTWFSSWGDVKVELYDHDKPRDDECKHCGEPMTLLVDPADFYTCEPCNKLRDEERENDIKSRKS